MWCPECQSWGILTDFPILISKCCFKTEVFVLWNAREHQQKIPKFVKSEWQQETIVKSAFITGFIIKSIISILRKTEGVKIWGCRQYDVFILKISLFEGSGIIKSTVLITSEISTFLTAKMSHICKNQKRTCCPCFILIYLIYHTCLTGTEGRRAAIWLQEATVTGEALWPHYSFILILTPDPLTYFLALSFYLGFLCQGVNLKHLLKVGKGGKRNLRSRKLVKCLHVFPPYCMKCVGALSVYH